jgi:hypothetical protein
MYKGVGANGIGFANIRVRPYDTIEVIRFLCVSPTNNKNSTSYPTGISTRRPRSRWEYVQRWGSDALLGWQIL